MTEELPVRKMRKRAAPDPPTRPEKHANTPCWHPVGATMRARGRASGATHYGPGAWDKIPYTLEVTGEVELYTPAAYTLEEVRETQDIAAQLAKGAVLRHLQPFHEDLVEQIRTTLFPELFNGR